MTKLELWNRALSLLPHDRVIKDVDENTVEARRCRDEWPGARLHVLASHEWGWLMRTMPVCAGEPCSEMPLPYSYARPNNAIMLIGLFNARGKRVKSEAYNGRLYTAHPASTVRYLPDEEDPAKMPPLVREACAYELAARLSPVITANGRRTSELLQLAVLRLRTAWLADAQETAWSGTDGDTFVNARR